MGSLFGSLNSSLGAIRAFQTALNVSQNNVSNQSTPGYARQEATFDAQPFNPSTGFSGGVLSGPTQTTQNEYANQAVRNQLSFQGGFGAQSDALSSIQALFDVSGQSGVIGALNSLFQSFSAWSTTPASSSAQQAVLSSAQAVAQNFQSTSNSLTQIGNSLNQQISATVQQINTLAADVRNDNLAILQSPTPDPGLDANLHASLEALSKLVDVTVTFASDGSATVLLGNGQAPLVIGNQQSAISATFSATDGARLLDASGQEITSQVSQGTLGGLLSVRNGVLASLQGDGTQQGALNQLAQQVADRVNQIMTAGQTLTGQPGQPLFAYNGTNPAGIAHTLTLDPNITAGTLAPTDLGPPLIENGTALTLSNLGNSSNPADQIGGQTILQFFASTAAQVGQDTADAQNGQSLHTQLLNQARSLQDQLSGVSLDAEALQVMELQKGYQAAAKMVTVVDSLTTTLLQMAG